MQWTNKPNKHSLTYVSVSVGGWGIGPCIFKVDVRWIPHSNLQKPLRPPVYLKACKFLGSCRRMLYSHGFFSIRFFVDIAVFASSHAKSELLSTLD